MLVMLGTTLALGWVPAGPLFEAAVLRSVWRLFWNHIVTDLISL